MSALEFFNTYNGSIGVVVAIVVSSAGFLHYISIRRAEERGRQYDRYHKLLEDLNVSPRGDAPFVDRQIAVVYEMRNFPEYYPVSLRILKRSLRPWYKLSKDTKLNQPVFDNAINTLYEEAQLTIKYIEKKIDERSYLCWDED